MVQSSRWFLPPVTRGDWWTCGVFLALCMLLYYVNLNPPVEPEPGIKARARVLQVDNSRLIKLGLVRTGSQILEVEVLDEPYRNWRFPASNELRAQMELDKEFAVGDIVWVGILHGAEAGKTMLNAQDYYRVGWTAVLFGAFCLLLIGFGGITGFKALLSFIFSCLVIWKLVIPLCLEGYDPIGIIFGCVLVLTAVIIFLVGGFTRKGVAAFGGAMLGVTAGFALAGVISRLFHINGAVMPYSQALLYSGYENLNLAEIFVGAIILASSGAVMDLGMDVAAGMEEIHRHNPELSRRELIFSGIRIGQSVVGTMTTTLLLAYSGGYITLMMTFAAQGTRPDDFINNPYVASEAVKTLVGSLGLILVAPFTALIGGVVFTGFKARTRS